MKVLVEYEFDKDEIDILCAVLDACIEDYIEDDTIQALMHLSEPLKICKDVFCHGNER